MKDIAQRARPPTSQRGDTPGWPVLAPIIAVTIIGTGVLIRLLSAIREPTGPIIDAIELGSL